MDLVLGQFLLSFYSFTRHAGGVIFHPYATYRTLAQHGEPLELLYIGVFSAAYFGLSSIVKIASFHPFLLTRQFTSAGLGALAGYILVVALLGIVGSTGGRHFSLLKLALLWGYTLLPTICWFVMTSVLYVLVPPPRTESVWGILFSLLYLTVSALILFWKAELFYLTARFGLQLDLVRIVGIFFLFLPFLGGYSYLMYRLGIFKIPFL